jgi:toxin CptA
MRNAPSVDYPAGRSALAARLEVALALVWVALQGAWAVSVARWPLPGAWWFACGTGALWFAWSRWRTRHPVEGCLAWEAPPPGGSAAEGRWIWTSPAYRRGTPLASVDWALDLQGLVLLRLRNAAGLSWWVWLERHRDPRRWGDLRRALVAHQGDGPPRSP